jgi:hypothetical protein
VEYNIQALEDICYLLQEFLTLDQREVALSLLWNDKKSSFDSQTKRTRRAKNGLEKKEIHGSQVA